MSLLSAALAGAAAPLTVLRGAVATLDPAGTIHRDAFVCIEGQLIKAVVPAGTALPPEFAGVAPVDSQGTIFPGLIELHNHLTYNELPLWTVPARYTNRNQWRLSEPTYNYDVAWPAKILGQNADKDYPRSIARFAECRALFGGVTTSQGIGTVSTSGQRGFYQSLVRVVEGPLDPAWPPAKDQTLDFSTPQISSELEPALQRGAPFIYHLAEGTDADAHQRFLDLQYQPGSWAIAPDLITIHCVGCAAADFAHLASAAGMVWSPLSNLLLYGQTADVAAAKHAGVSIALGSDWSPSGTKNLLGELKIAKIVSDQASGLFTNEELVRMVTSTPARMVQWDRYVGSVEAGKAADLLVLAGTAADPYGALITASEADIRLVMIGGQVRLGETHLVTPNAGAQEAVTIGGKAYTLDLNISADPLTGMSFAAAVSKLQYGLANMPQLGADFGAAHALLLNKNAAPSWTLELDLDWTPSETRAHLLAAGAGIDPSKLHAMALEPAKAVDDPAFIGKLKANPNLPAPVKAAL
jgi:5-methylthioadenosine/S-adenosylhomocysteine deaminase